MDVMKKSLFKSKKQKSGVAFSRQYIVFFNYGTDLFDNYAVMESENKTQALFDAYEKWGRSKVAKVEIMNEYSEQVVRLYGKSQII
jgi:hypothetical protein